MLSSIFKLFDGLSLQGRSLNVSPMSSGFVRVVYMEETTQNILFGIEGLTTDRDQTHFTFIVYLDFSHNGEVVVLQDFSEDETSFVELLRDTVLKLQIHSRIGENKIMNEKVFVPFFDSDLFPGRVTLVYSFNQESGVKLVDIRDDYDCLSATHEISTTVDAAQWIARVRSDVVGAHKDALMDALHVTANILTR